MVELSECRHIRCSVKFKKKRKDSYFCCKNCQRSFYKLMRKMSYMYGAGTSMYNILSKLDITIQQYSFLEVNMMRTNKAYSSSLHRNPVKKNLDANHIQSEEYLLSTSFEFMPNEHRIKHNPEIMDCETIGEYYRKEIA